MILFVDLEKFQAIILLLTDFNEFYVANEKIYFQLKKRSIAVKRMRIFEKYVGP